MDNKNSHQKKPKQTCQKGQNCGESQRQTQHFVLEKFFKKSLKKYKKIVDIKF